jgi:hypothetical protein
MRLGGRRRSPRREGPAGGQGHGIYRPPCRRARPSSYKDQRDYDLPSRIEELEAQIARDETPARSRALHP